MRVPDSGKTGTPRAERVEATTLTREADDALKRFPRPFSKSSSTQRVVPRGVCEGVGETEADADDEAVNEGESLDVGVEAEVDEEEADEDRDGGVPHEMTTRP
jgi:hypothetical protein